MPPEFAKPNSPDYQRLCQLAGKVKELDPDALMAFKAVHRVGIEMEAAMEEGLADYGMSSGRMRVMALLHCEDVPMSHSEIADRTNVTKGTVTGLIDGLERDGLVQRQSCCGDRRVMQVSLTKDGDQRIRELLPPHLKRLSVIMGQLTKQEQRKLLQLLDKVRAGMAELKANDKAKAETNAGPGDNEKA